MPETSIVTDYLVVGAGAAGLAFADALIAEDADAEVTIVDRLAQPGGHWNHAYPFVTLHQPSAFYGVNSVELGSGLVDSAGLNEGLAELASGAEVVAYFDRVMQRRLLPSGRVRFHPLSNYLGDGRFESLLSGARTRATVRRKVVDATYLGPSVPATHRRRFRVGEGATVVPPGALPFLWHAAPEPGRPPRRFVVLGAGKTAMDTCTWLLQSGADADAITWVVPRDAWLLDRATTQNAPQFFDAALRSQADMMQAFAEATSIADLYLRLEACGVLLRIDPGRTPEMFHLATITRREAELLRGIRRVVRLGRVQAVDAERMTLDRGEVAVAPGTVFVDCTASAVEPRPLQPIFQDGRIVLQLVRVPQPTFSAAIIAYVEVRGGDDARKNRLCAPAPFPHRLADYVRSMLVSMTNGGQWQQDEAMRRWVRGSRLDAFSKLIASADRDDAGKQALIGRFREEAKSAFANLARLSATDP
jgi:hypothetical protein